MKVLVTGGNGFLGSAIVRMLHARGDDVSILCRGDASNVSELVSSVFKADIRDLAAVQRACVGKDAVFHVAALTGIWGPSRDYISINVAGTRNVIGACVKANMQKLIYTSSPSVIFGSTELRGVSESEPYPKRYLADYPRTKAEAERMVLDANHASLATVALRPHLIWGPGDANLIPRVIERARRKKLVQVGDGRNLVDLTYIDNAAEAHLLAADALSPGAACAGRAYFISQGQPVALWPWIDQLLAAIGAPRVSRRISFSTAWCLGLVFEALYTLFRIRKEPLMTRFLSNQLGKSHYFDISAARRDFGYVPRVSLDEGMSRLVAWLQRFPAP